MSKEVIRHLLRKLEEAKWRVYEEPTHYADLYPTGSLVGLDPLVWRSLYGEQPKDEDIDGVLDSMELQMMGIKP